MNSNLISVLKNTWVYLCKTPCDDASGPVARVLLWKCSKESQHPLCVVFLLQCEFSDVFWSSSSSTHTWSEESLMTAAQTHNSTSLWSEISLSHARVPEQMLLHSRRWNIREQKLLMLALLLTFTLFYWSIIIHSQCFLQLNSVLHNCWTSCLSLWSCFSMKRLKYQTWLTITSTVELILVLCSRPP